MLSLFIGRLPLTAVWVFLAVTVDPWPQLAWWLASRSANGRQVELRKLLIDSFLLGSYDGVAGYSPWITRMRAAMNPLNQSVRDFCHSARALNASIAAASHQAALAFLAPAVRILRFYRRPARWPRA